MMTGNTVQRPMSRLLIGLLAGTSLIVLASPAMASSATDQRRFAEIERKLTQQQAQLADQARELEAQRTALAALRAERDQLAASLKTPQVETAPTTLASVQLQDSVLSTVRAGAAVAQVAPATDGVPGQPVGEAPPVERRVQEVAALPERAGVLTPKGRLVLEPSIEYVRSSANRLVFRGVEIVPGIQLGVIEANDADRDSAVATGAFRYGLTRRLEVDGRVPFVYRHDRITTLAQRDDTISRTTELEGQDIGDVEVALRYQLNEVRPGRPIYVANMRLKPPTGRGPYDVAYDEFGVATDLATGSGFWAVEGGLNMLYPTDPAVIFAGVSYLHNLPRDINKTIGTALVGRVEPGDSIGASLGFGLSLNPRFSVSFGYSHNYIFATKSQIGSTWQKSNSLQVGTMLMGWSFRLTEKMTLTNNFEFGVTSDAPNMRTVFSLPVRF